MYSSFVATKCSANIGSLESTVLAKIDVRHNATASTGGDTGNKRPRRQDPQLASSGATIWRSVHVPSAAGRMPTGRRRAMNRSADLDLASAGGLNGRRTAFARAAGARGTTSSPAQSLTSIAGARLTTATDELAIEERKDNLYTTLYHTTVNRWENTVRKIKILAPQSSNHFNPTMPTPLNSTACT